MTPLRSKLILVQVRTGGFGARVQTLQPARLAGDQAAGPGGGAPPACRLGRALRVGEGDAFFSPLNYLLMFQDSQSPRCFPSFCLGRCLKLKTSFSEGVAPVQLS